MPKVLLTRAQIEILCHVNDALRCEDNRVVADAARMHETEMPKALLTRAQTDILSHVNDALRCEVVSL